MARKHDFDAAWKSILEAFEIETVDDDVLSVITVFSAKLYGSRSHKNKTIVDNAKKMFEEKE